jgi:pimeloyl-ACP methyl ester carboxylesterase
MPSLEARGVELSWSERGNGAPVLLVHETAAGSAAWDGVTLALEGSARAIRYDRRGWGASTAPQGYARTTIEEQSEDAAGLLESMDPGPAVICGAGIGAIIALDLMLRHPALAAGAVLVEPPFLAPLPQATELLSRDRLELEETVPERGAAGAVDLYLSGGLAALGAGAERMPEAMEAEARERPSVLFAEIGAPAAWSMPFGRLAEAELPSLILTCPSTPPLLADAARGLQELLAGSELREVGGATAPPHMDDPAAVADAALEIGRS